MVAVIEKPMVVATPGFLDEARSFGAIAEALIIQAMLPKLAGPGLEPSMIVATTTHGQGQPDTFEDEGATVRTLGPFTFWAKRDDHDPECTCGCGGKSIVTFLLPSEY